MKFSRSDFGMGFANACAVKMRFPAGFGASWLALTVCGLLLLAATARLGANRAHLEGRGRLGLPNGDVTIRFRTEGFWQITQGMGTIQWDSHVADYVSAGDFGIPELNEGTFSRIPEGMLTFDWSSNNSLGNTLADGTVLFSLTFGVRGAPGDSTSVDFTNGWTPLHFESAESINLPFSSVPGGISVVPEPTAVAWLTVALLLGLCDGGNCFAERLCSEQLALRGRWRGRGLGRRDFFNRAGGSEFSEQGKAIVANRRGERGRRGGGDHFREAIALPGLGRDDHEKRVTAGRCICPEELTAVVRADGGHGRRVGEQVSRAGPEPPIEALFLGRTGPLLRDDGAVGQVSGRDCPRPPEFTRRRAKCVWHFDTLEEVPRLARGRSANGFFHSPAAARSARFATNPRPEPVSM